MSEKTLHLGDSWYMRVNEEGGAVEESAARGADIARSHHYPFGIRQTFSPVLNDIASATFHPSVFTSMTYFDADVIERYQWFLCIF